MRLVWFTAGRCWPGCWGSICPGRPGCCPLGWGAWPWGWGLQGWKKAPAARRVLFGAAAALVWLVGYGEVMAAPAQAMEYRTLRLEGVVTQWPEETGYGVRVPVKAGEEGAGRCPPCFMGTRAWPACGRGTGCPLWPTAPRRTRSGAESLYYPAKGVLLKAKGYGEVTVTPTFSPRYAPAILAGKIRQELGRLYPPEEGGFLCALLTGRKPAWDEGTQNCLNRVGLGHVVVVSGLHVSCLAGFLTLFLDPKKKGSLAALLVVLALFCLMTGSGPGTVRAAILCALALAAPGWAGVPPLTGLCFALLVLLAANPLQRCQRGAAVFSRHPGHPPLWTAVEPGVAGKLPKAWRRWAKPLVGVAAISLGAMVFTVPLSALYFGRFSCWRPCPTCSRPGR